MITLTYADLVCLQEACASKDWCNEDYHPSEDGMAKTIDNLMHEGYSYDEALYAVKHYHVKG